MSDSPRSLRAIVLAAITLCIVASLTGAKAVEDKTGPRIAIVDALKLMSEYNFTNTAVNEIEKRGRDLETSLRAWDNNPLLPDKEQRELGDLTVLEANAGPNAPGLTEAQKMRKKQILDQSKTLLDEFEALRNKQVKDMGPNDQARLSALNKAISDTQLRFNAELSKGKEELAKKKQDADTKVQKDMKETIAKVAKEKGINIVYSNNAVLYAETDITDAVLGQMNKLK